MKKSTKAVLLSALVFPGLGHFYLKKPVVGAALLLLAAVFTYIMMSAAIHATVAITQQIESGNVPLDVVAMSNQLAKQSGGSTPMLSIATYAFLLCWLVGIVDSYRVAKQLPLPDSQPYQ